MKSVLSTILCSLSLVAASALPANYERALLDKIVQKRQSVGVCPFDEAPPTTAAPKANVWAQISPEDNVAVWNLLHEESTGLNLTAPSSAKQHDNYVYWIDTLHTNKSDVLPYLDGSGAAPAQYARAILFMGAEEPAVSQEYMIGPLPVSTETTVEKLDYIYNGGMGGAVPFNARIRDSVRTAASDPLLIATMTSIDDLTLDLFNFTFYGSRNTSTTVSATGGSPFSFDGSQAFAQYAFRYPGTATYLTPLDFFVILDITGIDPSKYSVVGFVTKERFFPTEADLRVAYEAGELVQKYKQDRNPSWALLELDTEMGTRALENKFSPQTIELGGKRYAVDEDAQYIEYMGWSYYISFSRTLGITLYDIKYKGERVIYELGLQEALAQYGGNQPKASNTVYHDSYYSLGSDVQSLLEGYDCPYGSTFWNVTYHTGNKTTVNQDAICIFEQDMGFPLSRHRAGGGNSTYGFQNLGVVKGAALVTRTIATVGNYDYMFDYMFHQDGSLEIAVRASGYLQSSPYYEDQEEWGPRVQEATQGSLHDHILTYKVDFDIVDTKNSLEVSDLVVVNVTQPWWPDLGSFPQMQLNKSYLETETAWNWAGNNQAMYCVVNQDKQNKWGQNRGYRIVPGRSNIHLSVQDSPWSLKNAAFAKHHLAVTRQHDNEPLANSVQNVNLAWAPQQDFTKFFDDESVVQEDLVMWVNLGMHHFTRAEDIPVTLYTEAYSSMVFAPQNFNDRAQDGDLLNRRWIVPDAQGVLQSDDFGVALPMCSVNINEPIDSLSPVVSI